MSIDKRNRVDKGVTTGGQFAKESRSEDGSVTLSGLGTNANANFADPNDLPHVLVPIKKQQWIDDEAVTVEENYVDGRTLFAGMDREKLDKIMESKPGDSHGDNLYYQATRDGLTREWNGPTEFDAGQALRDLHEQDPTALDQLSEAKLDPNVYYSRSGGPNGKLVSSDETHGADLEKQYATFTKAQTDMAHLQLRPFVQDFEKLYPDAAEVNFAHDGDEDDPLFVSAVTMKDGTSEVHDPGSIDGDFPVFDAGNAIRTDRSYNFDEIRNFRPSR